MSWQLLLFFKQVFSFHVGSSHLIDLERALTISKTQKFWRFQSSYDHFVNKQMQSALLSSTCRVFVARDYIRNFIKLPPVAWFKLDGDVLIRVVFRLGRNSLTRMIHRRLYKSMQRTWALSHLTIH